MKLITGFAGLVLASSLLRADDGDAARYVPESGGKPDPKDMKGMTTLAPPPAETHYYVAAYGGAQFSTYYGNSRQTSNPFPIYGANNTTSSPIHSNWGGVGGLKFGYMFDSQPLLQWQDLRWQPAVEAEALYIGDNSHTTSFAGPGSQEKISTNSGDFFINGICRFPNATLVTPYFGCGAGFQYLTTHGTMWGPGNTTLGTGLDTESYDLAAQAIGGFDFRLCNHLSLFTEYKFIDALFTDGHSTNLPLSNTYRFKPDQVQQHLITAGVKYDF